MAPKLGLNGAKKSTLNLNIRSKTISHNSLCKIVLTLPGFWSCATYMQNRLGKNVEDYGRKNREKIDWLLGFRMLEINELPFFFALLGQWLPVLRSTMGAPVGDGAAAKRRVWEQMKNQSWFCTFCSFL